MSAAIGRRVLRGLLILVNAVLIVAVLLLGAVYVLTATDWGRNKIRGIAQNALNGMVHGKTTIGELSGNLLTGMTIHGLTITDSAGGPFVTLESFSAKYSVVALARKQIWLDNAVMVRPRIVLDRPPDGVWNWQRIFPHSSAPAAPSQSPGWLDRIRFTNASVIDGQLMVRTPWSPSAKLSAAAQDSAVREALAGKSRLMIQRAGTGFQKLVELDSVSAAFPLLRLSEPGEASRLIEVASLRMIALPFRPPAAVVKDLKGAFPFNNDSIWWKGAYAELPQSKASGDGSYAFNSGDMRLSLHSDPASFADLQWIYPRLPANGRGAGDLRLEWHGAEQDYTATNLNVSLGSARVAGELGITLGDTLTFHDTRLRVSGLQTTVVEQLIQGFKSPREGVIAGTVEAHGGRNALTINSDVTFDDRRAGRSRVVASGEVGFPERGGVRAHDLHLQLLPVQVLMARTWDPSLPVEGTVTGVATVNGSTQSELNVTATLDHRDRGTQSAVDGSAAIHLGSAKTFDVNLNARPVSLVEIGRFFPAAGLQGSATGPVHVTGALSNLRVNADLRLPDGGRFSTTGTLNLAAAEKGYDLTSTLYTVNLHTIDTKAPVTSLSAHAAVYGRGVQLATMSATVAADFSASRWVGVGPRDSVAIDTASLRGSVGGGVATVDKLYAVGAHTSANVSGTFGLSSNATGTLAYRVSTDSLGAFNRLFPRDSVAEPPVQPRPGVVARAYARARADSERVAKATEMERLINGRAGPALAVNAPKPVPADTLSGAVSTQGTLSGSIDDFEIRGTASGQNVVARGNYAHHLDASYDWAHVRTPQAMLTASVDADSASVMGFAFDTITARATYTSKGGHAEVAVNQGGNRRYSAKGDYSLSTDQKELRLADMAFQFDTVAWTMTKPSVIQWGGPGIRVTDLELRNRTNGRIYANGLLPTQGSADFALTVENFPVANIVDIAQTDLKVTGNATLSATMSGTMSTPSFRGTFGLTDATYNGVTVPTLTGRLGYADKMLVAHMDALRASGAAMATVDGRVPINLALSGVSGSRVLPDPMTVDLVADSLPLELIPQFTDVVSDVHGRAYGKLSVRGTLTHPVLSGGFNLDKGALVVGASGAKLINVTAAAHMGSDTVYIDSVAAQTKAGRTVGTVTARGTLSVADWRAPSMNLFLVSNNAELINNKYGNLRIDAGLALKGPIDHAYLSGAVTIVQGVIYAPEPGAGHHLIGAGDPALYNVLDTAVAADRDLFPTPSPLLANLRVEVELAVRRDTWVRNREANVEIYTEGPLSIRQEQQALFLTGVVATDRGEYEVLSKRFQIKRGSALFIGTPDLDPTLQITGEYQVNVAARGALNISVVVAGTLRHPKLSLDSDAQPPKTQSELLSLLAFGQSSTTLLSSTSSSVTGSAATGDLFGVGAQAAVQRLAGVAMGVAVQQVEMQAGRAFGTDVFDITPGDVPLFGGSGAGNFFTDTRVEAGKYINPRTFVSVQEQALRPGLSLEQREQNGWRFSFSMEPRILLGEPTLRLQPYRTVQAYGGFVIREWRF